MLLMQQAFVLPWLVLFPCRTLLFGLVCLFTAVYLFGTGVSHMRQLILTAFTCCAPLQLHNVPV